MRRIRNAHWYKIRSVICQFLAPLSQIFLLFPMKDHLMPIFYSTILLSAMEFHIQTFGLWNCHITLRQSNHHLQKKIIANFTKHQITKHSSICIFYERILCTLYYFLYVRIKPFGTLRYLSIIITCRF